MRKRVAILGSTGSIGTQALDVIARHPDRFEVVGLAAGRNLDLLREQVARFEPAIATSAADGPDGLRRAAVDSKPDVVLAATDGAVAFDAVLAAIERGTAIAVANKELIVAAGELFVAHARRHGARLLPVDSEHSAIFQCLIGEAPSSIAEIVVTASGGPFWRRTKEEMERADLSAALAHPTWRMGTKNTIDSATMMNKGLEVIEASRLFGIPGERVRIVVHPQSIAHGFAIFTDGSVKGQLAAPDMRVPIGYALAYPDRLPNGPPDARPPSAKPPEPRSALTALGGKPGTALFYEFEDPDPERFPCVRLAYQALAVGGTVPAVLSAANEVAVNAFVEGRIVFGEIAHIIEGAMDRVEPGEPTLEGVRTADRKARETATALIETIERPSRC
ncbi:MAG TPA: 1-deoxy-D-xylulose-5-phosphate reductoisomerase [Candidatus Baltobacteraceae bacterium]|nr:1-deoxy-D-xylulose-5-phosphate reductoisomerase [Candidatus Baltobacteraceae bacterium]